MTETITRDRALTMLREVVEAKGTDYVYDEIPILGYCTYVNPERVEVADEEEPDAGNVTASGELRPGCIIGHVLIQKLGIEPTVLWEYDRACDQSAVAILARLQKRGLLDVEFEVEALAALAAAQKKQDGNRPWGEALEAAEHVSQDVDEVRSTRDLYEGQIKDLTEHPEKI